MSNPRSTLSAVSTDPVSSLQLFVVVCFVAMFSYLAASIGGVLVMRPEMMWPVWPGCAFLVAVLLLTRHKHWPVLLIAGLAGFGLYDLQEALPIRGILILLVADSIEILVAALGISYMFGGAPRLRSVKALAKYSLFAVILAPVSVASIATSAFEQDSWWVGFFTESLALLTLTPAILSWVDIALTRPRKPGLHHLEVLSTFLGLGIVSYFTFVVSGSGRPALLYSLVPLLLWATVRLGIAGASTSMVLVGFVAIWGSVHRLGPFTGNTPLHDVLSLQLFLLVAGTSFMLLAVVVEDHKAAEQALAESEERLRLAAKVGRMFAYSWNAATDVVERSGDSADILGVNPDEVATGAGISAMVHPDDKDMLEGALAKLTVENPVLQITYRIVRPNGVVAYLRRNSRAYFDGNGNLKRIVGMVADVTERRRAKEALAGMTRKLVEAQEQERARIGRELHDDITQRLAMLSIELQRLQADPSEIQGRVQELRRQTDEIANDVQALSHELHASKLEYLGVVAGIRSWCREFGERERVEINFNNDVVSRVPTEIGLTLFRISQEALHNAAKHSGVKQIDVQLSEHPNEILLTISDAGKGFDIEAAKQGRGLGLASMEERVRLVNGTIAIDSKPMGGTTIHVRVPFESERQSRRKAV